MVFKHVLLPLQTGISEKFESNLSFLIQFLSHSLETSQKCKSHYVFDNISENYLVVADCLPSLDCTFLPVWKRAEDLIFSFLHALLGLHFDKTFLSYHILFVAFCLEFLCVFHQAHDYTKYMSYKILQP